MNQDLDRLGRTLDSVWWVQGAGGNVSIKDHDTLFVKASGRRLRESGQDGGYSAVPLKLARQALEGDAAAEQEVFAVSPRPSLETFFHAVGAKVVAHSHALGVLAWACRRQLSAPPPDVIAIEYTKPGLDLARLVVRELDRSETRALVLRSHGLIVYADSVEEAISETRRIDAACAASAGVDCASSIALMNGYRDSARAVGNLFVRALPRRGKHRGFLFPDAVVYAAPVPVASCSQPEHAAREVLAALGRPGVAIDGEGHRLAVARSQDQLDGVSELVCAHDWLEDHATEPMTYLTSQQEEDIATMPAERYRFSRA